MRSTPPSGSQIVGHLGAKDFATLTCSILTRNEPVHIQWSVQKFGETSVVRVDKGHAPIPGLSHVTEEVENTSSNVLTHSHITIRTLTHDLDNVVVFCGTQANPQQANFTLKIYCKFTIT